MVSGKAGDGNERGSGADALLEADRHRAAGVAPIAVDGHVAMALVERHGARVDAPRRQPQRRIAPGRGLALEEGEDGAADAARAGTRVHALDLRDATLQRP